MPGCKPGDLAQIRGTEIVLNNGHYVMVQERCSPEIEVAYFLGVITWRCIAQGELFLTPPNSDRLIRLAPGERLWMPDRKLYPIRDPGEDAVDEMVALHHFRHQLKKAQDARLGTKPATN